MRLGDFVRFQRKKRELTQQQLADLAGVGLNFVYQLEKNKATVQLDCTQQVLNALGYQIGVTQAGHSIIPESSDAPEPPIARSEASSPRELPW